MVIFHVLALAAGLGAQEPGKDAPAPADGPRRFSLVYTVNNFGVIEPQGCPYKILHDGGIPRRMTCIRQLASAEGPLLLLDGGATLFPDIDKPQDEDRAKLLLKAELIAEAYSRMGYQAMAIGTSDLLLGIGELTHLIGRMKFPVLCANLDMPAGNPFKPYAIVELNKVRIGVIGLGLESMGRKYLERVLPGGTMQPALPTAQRYADELRGKIDILIVLSHTRQEINEELARKVKGVDIIIDPYIEYQNHHSRIKDEEWERMVDRTAVLRADGNGAALGVVEIEVRKAGAGMASRARLAELEARDAAGTAAEAEKAELADLRGRNVFFLRRLPLAPHYADDAEGAALVDAFRAGEDVSGVKAQPAPSGRTEYLTVEGCKDCHEKQYKNWQGTRHALALDGVLAGGSGRRVECISCHATGYGPAFVHPDDTKTYAGVQCEACHGAQPEHAKDPKANRFPSITEQTCLPCHNQDVTGKDISYFSALPRVKCPTGN